MTTSIPNSWQDRLAIINEFHLSNEQAIAMFNTNERELVVARGMVERGVLKIPPLSTTARGTWMPLVLQTIVTPVIIVTNLADIHLAPADTNSDNDDSVELTVGNKSAQVAATTKPVKKIRTPNQIDATSRRGRPSNKIEIALNALTTTPVPADEFVARYGVSKNVLRQSKRFVEVPIRVSIRHNRETNLEMICRM